MIAVETVRDTIRTARRTRTAVDAPPARLTVEQAYQVQREVFGQARVGWKLGLVSRAKQEQMGMSEPIRGHLGQSDLLRAPATVRLDRFIQPRIEPELAAVLGADVPPGTDARRAADAVEKYVLALDVLDSVWRAYRFTIADVIADNASGGAAVVAGEAVTPGPLQLFVDDEPAGAGELDPAGPHLAWLAGEVGGLRAGEVVLLGSPTAAVPARRGEVRVRGGGRDLLVTIS